MEMVLYIIHIINRYNDKRKIKKVIFKFKNLKKNEKIRKEIKKIFCFAELEYLELGKK